MNTAGKPLRQVLLFHMVTNVIGQVLIRTSSDSLPCVPQYGHVCLHGGNKRHPRNAQTLSLENISRSDAAETAYFTPRRERRRYAGAAAGRDYGSRGPDRPRVGESGFAVSSRETIMLRSGRLCAVERDRPLRGFVQCGTDGNDTRRGGRPTETTAWQPIV